MAETNKKARMMAMREQGMKHREIAEVFGVSRQYVAKVCGHCDPAHFRYVDEGEAYPNLRRWMNENKVSRFEFLRRMGLTLHAYNASRLGSIIRGETQPNKAYIDKMLAVTGMTYEVLFSDTEVAPAEKIVRCRDCKHWSDGVAGCTDHIKCCKIGFYMVGENGYCVYGEAKDGN